MPHAQPAWIEPERETVRRRQIELGGRRCTVETAVADVGGWGDRQFAMFISIKNRDFNRALVSWFVELCEDQEVSGFICPVDEPYLYNRMAELAVDRLDDDEVARIERLTGDRGRMAAKVLRQHGSSRVSMVSWGQLSAATPDWMKREVDEAYRSPGLFRDAIQQAVRSVKSPPCHGSLDRFARFFLCETPVLMHACYAPDGGLVDFYPGPNQEVFWMIEQGRFARELPRTTEFVTAQSPLVYVDAGGRSAA